MSWSAAPPLLLAVYVQRGHLRVQPLYPSSPNIGVRDRGASFSGPVRYVARRRRGKSSHLVMHEKKWNPGSNETAYESARILRFVTESERKS